MELMPRTWPSVPGEDGHPWRRRTDISGMAITAGRHGDHITSRFMLSGPGIRSGTKSRFRRGLFIWRPRFFVSLVFRIRRWMVLCLRTR